MYGSNSSKSVIKCLLYDSALFPQKGHSHDLLENLRNNGV